MIPAYHIADRQKSCSIQIITEDGSWRLPFASGSFQSNREGICIGENRFSRQGITVNLHGTGIEVAGSLHFGPFDPTESDIMGPFQYVPFLQCRHSVFSMGHPVSGQLSVNGQPYVFEKGRCYAEGDRGRSFPREYLWTHCFFPDGSIMLSAADVPLGVTHILGIIGVVHYRGKEYRLATYLGARAVGIRQGEVFIRQGRNTLVVRQLEHKGHPLSAPQAGQMSRTIHETAACRAYYHFRSNGKTVFEFESDQASFEYEFSR